MINGVWSDSDDGSGHRKIFDTMIIREQHWCTEFMRLRFTLIDQEWLEKSLTNLSGWIPLDYTGFEQMILN